MDNTGIVTGFSPINDEEKLAFELAEKILLDACLEEASDLHFEPFRTDTRVRYRVDGVLKTISNHPPAVLESLVRVVKKAANLDPDQDFEPQDGRLLFRAEVNNEIKPCDLRLSTLPTLFGEKLVMRRLDPVQAADTLKGGFSLLGFTAEQEELIKTIIEKPYGLVIFNGPTGSGKTTTAYASLSHLAGKYRDRVNIVTLEHPVEIALEGVIQSAVDPEKGYNYYNATKSVFRQDPDIVFVSEIQVADQAQLVLQMALTGHMTMTQLHASDAAGAIYRLIGIGAEPYVISMILEGIISQRLVRKICPDCKKKVEVNRSALVKLGVPEKMLGPDASFYKGEGCEKCRFSGYKGRVGIYEIVGRSDELMDFIAEDPGEAALEKKIRSLGYENLRQSAIQAALRGETTIEEAIRITPDM